MQSPAAIGLTDNLAAHRQVFLYSILLSLAAGLGYLMFRVPQYQAKMTLPVKPIPLTSKKILVPVINKLNLQVRYYNDQILPGPELFGDESPLKINLLQSDPNSSLAFSIEPTAGGMIDVENEALTYIFRYGDTVKISGVFFTVTQNKAYSAAQKKIRVRLAGLNFAAEHLIGAIEADPAIADSASIGFSFTTTSSLKAEAISRELRREYLQENATLTLLHDLDIITYKLDSLKTRLKDKKRIKGKVNSILVRQSEVNLYFYLFQEREEMKRRLAAINNAIKNDKIDIIRLNGDPFIILLLSLIAGVTIPFVYLFIKNGLKTEFNIDNSGDTRPRSY